MDIYTNNKELNKLEIKEKKILLESLPTNIMAVLTKRCNLECIMCTRVREEEVTLPFEMAKKLYRLFPYLEWINWQGGEVFLIDYFKELFLETARHTNIKQHIITNGLLIDRKWAAILAQSNVDLLYSIDGVTKDTYEFIRYPAKFEDLIRSIELVNEYREEYKSSNKLEMSVVMMKSNYKESRLFLDFCRKYNFNHLIFNILWSSVVPEEDVIVKPDPVAHEYLRGVISEIRNCCREYNINFDCFFDPYLVQNKHTCADSGPGATSSCLYPWKRLSIEPDGTVKPACQCSVSLGDLENNTLEELWNGPVMQKYRSSISNAQETGICSMPCRTFVAS